jgi:hypothetical protein
MAAVFADVLRVPGALFHEPDPVSRQEADQRVPDLALVRRVFQETVAAVAGVLDEAMTVRDRRDPVPEQAAGVPHFLGEQ